MSMYEAVMGGFALYACLTLGLLYVAASKGDGDRDPPNTHS